MEGHVEGNFTGSISQVVHNVTYVILAVSYALVDCRIPFKVNEWRGLHEDEATKCGHNGVK